MLPFYLKTPLRFAEVGFFCLNCAHVTESSSKRLFIRLSSLGDLILCSSALQVVSSFQRQSDWITSEEFAPLLEGHPRLGRVWRFRRKDGFFAWIHLCRDLYSQGYDEVIDLHRSLRSTLLLGLFFLWSLRDLRMPPRIQRLSKSRWRLWGYFVFKRLWPAGLRPSPLVVRASLAAGGNGAGRPDLRHLLLQGSASDSISEPYFCLMPGSLWEGKRYPVSGFAEIAARLHRSLGWTPVVLGSSKDSESIELCKRLESEGVRAVSGVNRWNLSEVAAVLARAKLYVGNDTGLSHLAEAVGTPAHVIFGPTVPGMGFCPWRSESVAYGDPLWCRPCGLDGRYCFRVSDRYRCMRDLEASQILSREAITSVAQLTGRGANP